MKNSILWMIALLVFTAVGCSYLENSTKTNPIPQEVKPEDRIPLIEIWQELYGSVAIEGKSLYFRMLEDGAIEFEHELKKRTGFEKPRYVYSIEKNPPTKISEAEYSRFKSLIEDLTKNKSLKEEYPSVGLIFDVETKLTIHLKHDASIRKITLNNSDSDVIDKSLGKNFPKVLVKLMKETSSIRARFLEEKRIR